MSTGKINNRKDLLLLVLFSPGIDSVPNQPIEGRTKLIKAIFLFKKEVWKKFKKDIEIEDEKMYEFFPWNYGPFSKEIYEDINFFILHKFIEVEIGGEMVIEEAAEWNHWRQTTGVDDDDNEFLKENIRLTERGVKFAEELYETLSQNQKEILKEFKSRIQTISLRALLKYVYRTYPDQITKSTIKDQVL